jgi:hypothetical protein
MSPDWRPIERRCLNRRQLLRADPAVAQFAEKRPQLARFTGNPSEDLLALLLGGYGGQSGGWGHDAFDGTRHFERSQDWVDAAVDQRERVPEFEKRIHRGPRNQSRYRADNKKRDQEPRPQAAGPVAEASS